MATIWPLSRKRARHAVELGVWPRTQAGHLATSFRRVYGALATSWAALGFVLMSGEPPGPAGSIGYAWEGAGAVRHATPSYTRV